jgi:hypothetical protein
MCFIAPRKKLFYAFLVLLQSISREGCFYEEPRSQLEKVRQLDCIPKESSLSIIEDRRLILKKRVDEDVVTTWVTNCDLL